MKFHQDGTLPSDGEVFVFGSNLRGLHYGGAAHVAVERYGMADGVTQGLYGQAYAIPTADGDGEGLPLARVSQSAEHFLGFACVYSGIQFFVTRIGCGIAGFQDAQIAPMFANAPGNVSLPEPWRVYVGNPAE